MTAITEFSQTLPTILLWGLVATALMATVLEGSQLLGISRMSLPFLFGAAFSDDRRTSLILGYVLYLMGGWLFAFFYALLLDSVGPSWWAGGLIGLAHGAFLVTVFLPLLPWIHPRLATDHDGPDALRRLEPPGAFGMNYGRATPLTTIAAQVLYGVVFGLAYALATG